MAYPSKRPFRLSIQHSGDRIEQLLLQIEKVLKGKKQESQVYYNMLKQTKEILQEIKK